MNFLHAIASAVIAVSLGVAGLFGYVAPAQQYSGTASNSQVSAVFETSLAAPLGAADTSLTMATNAVDSVGDVLPNIYTCFTVDQGQPNNEFLCGTVNGSMVTGLVRGLSPLTGTTTVAALAQAHRRGADIKITDWPTLGILNNQANGIETYPNLLQYSPNVLITGGSPSTTIATKYYVDHTASAGASNASESVNGISQLATGAQSAAGTSIGSTLARLVLPNSLATSTPYSGTPQGSIPSTGVIGGKLSQLFLDLTQWFHFSQIFSDQSSSTNATSTNQTVTGNFIANNATFTGTVNGLTTFISPFTAGQSITAGQLVCILPFPASQVTLDTTAQFTATGSSVSQTFTVGVNSNRGLVVDLVAGGSDATGITYNGVSMTEVNTGSITGVTNALDQWYLNAPATGTNNLVITFSGSRTTNVIVYSYYNVSQSGQPEAKVSSYSTAPSGNIIPLTNGGLITGTFYTNGGTPGGSVYTNNKVTNAVNTNMVAGDSGVILPPSLQSISVSGGSGNLGVAAMSLSPVETSVTPRVYVADISYAQVASSTIGFATANGTTGNSVNVQTDGTMSGLSGLTIGGQYFLSTAGTITTSPGSSLRKIGIGLSATTLLMMQTFQ